MPRWRLVQLGQKFAGGTILLMRNERVRMSACWDKILVLGPVLAGCAKV